MGDEADADWQEGLIEWGIEVAKIRFRDEQYQYRKPRKMPKRRAQPEDARKKGE